MCLNVALVTLEWLHSCWSSKGVVKICRTMYERVISISHESDVKALHPDFVPNFHYNLGKILSDVKQLWSTFLIVLGDFSTKSKTWLTHDITTNAGVQIESLPSTYGLHQLILDPTLISCKTHPHVQIWFPQTNQI